MKKYPAFISVEREINSLKIKLNVPTEFEMTNDGSNVFRAMNAIVQKTFNIYQHGYNVPYDENLGLKEVYSYSRMSVKNFTPQKSMAKLQTRGKAIENFIGNSNIIDLHNEEESILFEKIFEEFQRYFEIYYNICYISNEYIKYSDLKIGKKTLYKNNVNYYFLSDKEKNNCTKELEKVEIGFKKEVCDYNLYHLLK